MGSSRFSVASSVLVGLTSVLLMANSVPALAEQPKSRSSDPVAAAEPSPVAGEDEPEGVPSAVPGDETVGQEQTAPAVVDGPRSGSARVEARAGRWTRAGRLPVLVRPVDDGSTSVRVRVELRSDAGVARGGGVLALRVRTDRSAGADKAGGAGEAPASVGRVRVRLDLRGFGRMIGGNFADRLRIRAVPACYLSNGSAPEKNPHCQQPPDVDTGVDEVGEGFVDFTADVDPEPGQPDPDDDTNPEAEAAQSASPSPMPEPSPSAVQAEQGGQNGDSRVSAEDPSTAPRESASAGQEPHSSGESTADPKAGPRGGDASGRPHRVAAAAGAGASSYLLSAGVGGSGGTFASTPLQPSAAWTVGLSSGEFSTTYPVPIPPAPGGDAPAVALTYSSAAVDGRTSATNNQASWAGMGWEYEPGFVERRYRSCVEDGHPTLGDLCWASEHVVLNLGGRSGALHRHPTTGLWRLAGDTGWRIQKLTGAGNGDNDGEHWVVTDLDGTRYTFGLGREPVSGEVTSSTFTVPVLGDDSGEPCRASSLSASLCRQGWRWNLDRVVDRHGNTTTLYYAQESNSYGRLGNPNSPVSYTRAGHVTRIDYGQRAGAEQQPASARVVFETAPRCVQLTGCPALTRANAASYPDVPVDLLCSSGCTDRLTPAFFSGVRLAAITTSYWAGSAYRSVDRITLTHSFPSPGDGSDPTLWLASIGRVATGSSSTPNLSAPAVRFSGVRLANRVDNNPSAGVLAIPMYRINGIRNELGGLTQVSYGRPRQCDRATLPAPSSNTRDCFPVYWVPDGGPAGFGWYHKNLVTKIVITDQVTGSPAQPTTYSYEGGAAWHHDDDPVRPAAQQSWAQWRGYGTVLETIGGTVGRQTRSRTLFLRGMDGDRQLGGTTRSVVVTDSDGRQTRDSNALAGQVREQRHLNSAGVELEGTLFGYTQTRTVDGLGLRDSIMVRPSATETRTRITDPDDPSRVSTRRSGTRTSYDTSYGLPVAAVDAGDLAISSDDVCRATSRTVNASLYLIDFPRQQLSRSGSCSSGALLERTDLLYDASGTLGAMPTRGDVRAIRRYTSSSAFVEERSSYDPLGRVTGQRDGNGNLFTTTYSPTSGPLRLTMQTSTRPVTLSTRTSYDPSRGLPLAIRDPNGHLTETAYDALGRATAVWLPTESRAQGSQPSRRATYTLSQTSPSHIRTETRQDSHTWLRTWQYVDSLGRPRETQTPAQVSGRSIAAQRYDDRGLLVAQTAPLADTGDAGSGLKRPLADTVTSENRTSYDELGRATGTALYSAGTPVRGIQIVQHGTAVTVVPPQGLPTTRTFDAHGRLTEVHERQAAGTADAVTRYSHDPLGRLSVIADARGNRWTRSYDLLGRQTRSSDPDAGSTTRRYDHAGNIVEVTDGTGTSIATSYDGLHRPIRRTSGSTSLAEYSYDRAGTLGLPASSTRIAGGARYSTSIDSYDARNRPTRRTWTVPHAEGALAGSYTLGYSYDAADHLSRVDHPAAADLPAEAVTTTYDDRGFATTLSSPLTSYVSSTRYDNAGHVLQRQLGSPSTGLLRSYSYDSATGDLEQLRATTSSSTLQDLRYQRLSNGDLHSITDTLASTIECFAYDGRSRLTQRWTATADDCGGPRRSDERFTYDTLGRTLQRTTDTTTTALTYPADGSARPHAPATIGGRTQSYDNAGRLVSDADHGSHRSYTWGLEGDLRAIDADGQRTTLLDDADGNRLLRRDESGTTLYIDGLELTAPSSGPLNARRSYSIGRVTIAERHGPTPQHLQWLLGNHLGSLSATVTDDGDVSRTSYTAYGASTSTTPASSRSFLNRPADAGLAALDHRHLDTDHGRFLKPDPLLVPSDPRQLNAYTYAAQDPINNSDPSGLLCLSRKCVGDALGSVGRALANAPSAGANGFIELGQTVVNGYANIGYLADHLLGSGRIRTADVDALKFPYPYTGKNDIRNGSIVAAVTGLASAARAATKAITRRLAARAGPPATLAPPTRVARVVDADDAPNGSLGFVGADSVFVAAADDIADVVTSRGLAERLALVDARTGGPRSGPFRVYEFDTPPGLTLPADRVATGYNAAFVPGGRTAGGAREFELPNYKIDELTNVTERILQ